MTSADPAESQAKVVQDILAAKTLYDVLSVTSDTCSNGSQLRKAYLVTSVKVHPDKNTHPEATAAFQRVAEAYATLNDTSSRAQYDADLRGSRGASFASDFGQHSQHQRQEGGTQYAYDFERSNMPSFTEALFMFATATSMLNSAMGGSGRATAGTGAAGTGRASSTVSAASDFMQTIFWATQLSEGRQQQQQQQQHDHHQQRNFDPNDPTKVQQPPSTADNVKNNPMKSGMALGSGLRAIAATQRMMGMKKGAAATEKAAATIQVAALGATVLKAAQDNPAVQRTLERGQNSLRDNPQIGKGLLASMKMVGGVISSLQAAQQEAQQHPQSTASGSSSGGGGGRNSSNAAR